MKDYVSEYRNKRPIYEALCSVVAQVIEASFGQANVRFHSIDPRAKDVDSFERKACKTDDTGAAKYQNPLEEITDLAGVRVIVFTIDDIATVTEFVDENILASCRYSSTLPRLFSPRLPSSSRYLFIRPFKRCS